MAETFTTEWVATYTFHMQNQSGTERTTRRISFPIYNWTGEIQGEVITGVKASIVSILAAPGQDDPQWQDLRQFIQPSGWRDQTGSNLSDPEEPYTTVAIDFEVVKTEESSWKYEDLFPSNP